MVIDQAKKNYEVLYNTNHHAHVLLFVLAARDALSLNLSKEDVDKLSEKVGCHLRGHKRVKSFKVNYLLGSSLCRNATCLCDRSPLDPITPGIHSTPSVEISLTPRFLRGRFRSATPKSLALVRGARRKDRLTRKLTSQTQVAIHQWMTNLGCILSMVFL